MSPKRYRTILEELELTQSQFGQLLGQNAVTGRRWATRGPPMPVSILLHFLEWGEVTPAKIEQARREIIAAYRSRGRSRSRKGRHPLRR